MKRSSTVSVGAAADESSSPATVMVGASTSMIVVV